MNDQAEIVSVLKELLSWTKVGFFSQVKTMLEGVLNDEKKRLIYYLADGTKGAEDIRKLASTSPNKVSACFKSWELMGIMETLPNGNRLHKFDLEQFGMSVAEEAPKKVVA